MLILTERHSCSDPPETICILCHCLIDPEEYAAHRVQCALRNAFFLAELKKAPSAASCPKCSGSLRLWPPPRNHTEQYFTCHASNPVCPVGSQDSIANNGTTRYTCFVCNYNMCLMCVNRRVPNFEQELARQRLQRLREARQARATTSSRSHNPVAPSAPPQFFMPPLQPITVALPVETVEDLPPSYKEVVYNEKS